MTRISCRIEGVPVPKGRPRFTRYGGVYSPKTTVEFERRVAEAWRDQHGETMFHDEPLQVHLNFGVVNMSQDIDNLAKSVLDGLNGVAWTDDKQVIHLNAWKYPTSKPEAAVNVIIRAVTPEQMERLNNCLSRK